MERHFLKCQNDTSGSVEITSLEVSKGHGNKTDSINTEYSDTDSFYSDRSVEKGSDAMRIRAQYEDYFRDSLELDYLSRDRTLDQDALHAMVDLMVDVCCSTRKSIRINREDMPIEVVKSRFMKLDDGLESTNDNLRFFGEGGQVITMGGWHECEEWLNGVVFDDPQVMNRVEIILHPERFPEKDPGRAALRAVEDAVEQNDNSFDGIINNLPETDPTLQACKCADEEAKQSVLAKLKEQQLHEPPHRPERPFIFCGPEESVRE